MISGMNAGAAAQPWVLAGIHALPAPAGDVLATTVPILAAPGSMTPHPHTASRTQNRSSATSLVSTLRKSSSSAAMWASSTVTGQVACEA